MKQLLSAFLIGLLACTSAFGLATQKTNTVNLVLANVCDGSFNDFKFQISGYDDQVFKFNYDQALTGIACQFRITKPIDGTIYLDVPLTSIAVSGTNATFSIARSNIPPPGSYYGELLSFESATTNYYRSLAQGKLPVTWSLYLNESNFFARTTNTAAVGQVYVHPSWIDPPWLSSTSALGAVYFTIANSTVLSNWTDVINTKATNNLASITALQGYSNYALTAYNWGNYATNNFLTNDSWTTVSNTVTANAENGNTAYGWGDWSGQGFLSATTNIYIDLYAANRAKLGTNLSTLTQGVYTGSLTTVSYTGAVSLVIGRVYAWGYSHIGSGTSTLSIAGNSLIKSAAGNYSNYFTYHSGEGSNLVLKLDGTGLAIGNASNLYVKQITNGNISAAGDLLVGGNMYLNGALFSTAGFVQTNNSTYTDTVAKASAAYPSSNPSNYVTVSVTNDLNTVVGTKYPSSNPSNFYLSSNPSNWVDQTVTNALNTRVDGMASATNDLSGRVKGIEDRTNTWESAYTNAIAATTDVAAIKAWPTNDWATSGATNAVGGDSFSYDPVTRTLTIVTNATGGSGTTNASGINVAFTPTNYVAATPDVEAHLVAIDSNIETNYLAFHGESNVVIRVDATNIFWGVPAVDDLKAATGALNSATGSLNTAVGNLNSATNNMNVIQTALVAASNAVSIVANAAIPKTSTNSFGVVEIRMPANGIIYFGTTTNYIQDQAGTNFLFKIGTNTINFGI